MKTQAIKPVWNQEPTEAFWKRINDLIPHAKEDVSSFDKNLNEEREFLREFINDYEKNSYNQPYLKVIDDLSQYGYIGTSKDDSEALLLKSIIAVAEKKQRRPLWEVLHMIVFNRASYRRFFETYLPIPIKVKNFLGSIIARLENQRSVIKEDFRLKSLWEAPGTAW